MIEIELPCCGTVTYLVELSDTIGCETCGVVLEFDTSAPAPDALALAA